MADRIVSLLIDVTPGGKAYDAAGNEVTGTTSPYIYLGENIQLNLQFIVGAPPSDITQIVKYTGFASSTIACEAAVDNNYTHYTEGALTANKSGSVTSLSLSGLNAAPRARSGTVQLINSAGQFESVDFTAYSVSSGVYTFTVAATLTYSYLTGDTVRVLEPPIISVGNSDIDQTNKATGAFVLSVNGSSTVFESLVKGLPKIPGLSSLSNPAFEFKVYIGGVIAFVSVFELKCLNLINFTDVIAPAIESNYYTKTEADSRYIQDAPSDTKLYARQDGAWEEITNAGDVVGPASAPSNNLSSFDGVTGKLIKDSGIASTAVSGHISSTSNPHSVTATQVGKDTAQWNANKLQGTAISNTAPSSGQVLKYNGTSWIPDTVSGTGDVIAPATNSADYIPQWNGANSKTLKNGIAYDVLRKSSSGVVYGGVPTLNNSTTFNISAGLGIVVTNPETSTPTYTVVTWTAQSALSVTYRTTNIVSFVYIDSTGTVNQSTSEPTPNERRSRIYICKLVHFDMATLTDVIPIEALLFDTTSTLLDFMNTIGNVNISGNDFSAASTDLTIKKSAGSTFRYTSNYATAASSPNITGDSAINPVSFLKGYRDGSDGWTLTTAVSSIDPDYYDNGSGTLAALSNGKFVAHRLWFFPSSEITVMQYGQKSYDSMDDAKIGISVDSYVTSDYTKDASLRGILIVKKGTTNLATAADAFFVSANKFNLVSGGSGGSSGGEANTASNLGAGTGLYAQKSGVDLQFKSLVAGTGISLSNTTTEVTVTNTLTTAASVNAVALSGDETVAGVKTFSSSPIVPTPTTDMQAATKKYVDDNAGSMAGYPLSTDLTASDTGKNLSASAVGDVNTRLQLHFDATFADSSPYNLSPTVTGSAAISSTQSKFGGSSAYFPAYTDYVEYTIPTIGTGDFSIEFWAYHTSNPGGYLEIGSYSDNNGILLHRTSLHLNGGGAISFSAASNGAWNHFRINRSGTSVQIFINGISVASATSSANITRTDLRIGAVRYAIDYGIIGYIDEFRFSNISRGTSDFTPPTSAYVDIIKTFQLVQPDISLCQGRLTLESGVAVSTSDQTAKTTLYWTPYNGNQIALYNGSAWILRSFTETSLSLSGYTADTNYDVFAYDSAGTLALASTAWTNATARATSLMLQNGIYVKNGDATRRYLGTIRTTATAGQCEDSQTKRFVWNYYNQVEAPVKKQESTSSWTYSSTTVRYLNNSSSNKIELVQGLASKVKLDLYGFCQRVNTTGEIAFGVDSSTTMSADGGTFGSTSSTYYGMNFELNRYLSSGYHYIAILEHALTNDTVTFMGTGGTGFSAQTTGIIGTINY